MEKINNLRKEVYQIAVAHGWHEEDKSDMHWLTLIASEVAEVVEADRKGKRADKVQYLQDLRYALQNKAMSCSAYDEYRHDVFECWIKDSVEDELADVVIRCLDLAGLRRIVLEDDITSMPLVKERIEKESIPEWAYRTMQLLTSSHCDTSCKISLVMFYAETLAGVMGIDLEFHIKEKVKYNRGREYKHGKRY